MFGLCIKWRVLRLNIEQLDHLTFKILFFLAQNYKLSNVYV